MGIDSAFSPILADVVLVVHACFVLFVVGGQLLILVGWALSWVWTSRYVFRILHLIAIGFVMLESWCGVTCPLTLVENKLRHGNEFFRYERSFIGHWTERLIYFSAPDWLFTLIYTAFALLVLLTWLAHPPKRKL